MHVRSDCRHYKGDKPCTYNTTCLTCLKFKPQGIRILIIKLSASGDVLRTTPILYGLKRKYPHSFITWITKKEAADLLENNNYIDRLLICDFPDIERLKIERFDILICLDKETEAAVLASQVKAGRKIGFGLSPRTGNLIPLNRRSRYSWKLGLSDELKFYRNKKSYPRIIFEMAGLAYNKDEYILNITESDKRYAQGLLDKAGVNRSNLIIGLNTGAGSRFANKAWTEQGFVKLINLIHSKTGTQVVLLGGPQEHQRNAGIISQAGSPVVYDTGCFNTLGQFCAILDCCRLVVSADTTALHIAIALKKQVVALFGPTCDQEIELYGRGIKVVSGIGCRPCYKGECDKKPNCMDLIKAEQVWAAIKKLLPEKQDAAVNSAKV